MKTIEWHRGVVRLIDQTRLPEQVVMLDIDNVDDLAEAICSLRVRGAPAIGVAAGLGVAMAAWQYRGSDTKEMLDHVKQAMDVLGRTRPTAVNLFWAINRMEKVVESLDPDASRDDIREQLLSEAMILLEEDRHICNLLGVNGATLIPEQATVLTHCNAGGLATSEFGTALAVIYHAVNQGKQVKVFADETRPLLQGARLTSWELHMAGVDVTVLCDAAAASLMHAGRIDCIVVGADRIASNGDTANKVGTYMLAVLAEKHRVPFYVVAPVSTFDFSIDSGRDIPIEERTREEIVRWGGRQTVPDGVPVYNPAFDVTPHALVTAIVTEKGVLRAPYTEAIRKLKCAV